MNNTKQVNDLIAEVKKANKQFQKEQSEENFNRLLSLLVDLVENEKPPK